MARIAMDTRAQNSWKELIDKETSTRLHHKRGGDHNDLKDDDDWFDRNKYNNKSKPISHGIPTIVYPPKPVRVKTLTVAEQTAQMNAKDYNDHRDMVKVDPTIEHLLYDGFSKEQKGRYQYLKARKQDGPEQKYEYPLLTSYDYGWKLDETGLKYQTPKNGRSKIVEDSFYRRNGIL
jgi:hypothetical protein